VIRLRWNPEAAFQVILKPMITYGKGRGRFPTNNQYWGRTWVVPGQVRVVPEPKHG
jgi:hypothetical protein